MPALEITMASELHLEQIQSIVNHYILNDTCIYDTEPRTLETVKAWFHNQCEHSYPVFVALNENEVLGYATYGQFRPKIGYRFSMEHSVYVRPDIHSHGVGKALMMAIIDHARTHQVNVLIGGIDADNQNSIEFHRKFGFEEVGKMPQVGYKFDRWLDLVWMQKIL